jgi:hypothetical protein
LVNPIESFIVYLVQMFKYVLLSFLTWFGWVAPNHAGTFEPTHRLTAMGVARGEMSEELLAKRTDLMIETQTFAILRDPRALAGAQRITSPRMQKIFAEAARRSGLPASLISAVAYLESWGDSKAQSPTGPRGIMQIAGGTARTMGLRMIYAKRYRISTERRTVKTKSGKIVTRAVKRRTPYQVLVRDERMQPERAIPAAATYLARLQNKFDGLDWAVFAYHCGEGCVGSMREMTERAKGIKPPYTVAKMFFSATPARNRELYEAVQREMERDFSPTYYFRIMRAQQLLEMYRLNPAEFKRLVSEYRYETNPTQRAPHRLALWLRTKDLHYQNSDDIKRDEGTNLVRVPSDEDYFGFRVHTGDEEFLEASPSAVGTLMYVAFETRRLYEAMKPKEKWVPLEVTSLVRPLEAIGKSTTESPSHGSGQVFDIEYRNLPLAEREALDFVLHDMGWEGYVGFVEEAPGSGMLHIGCAPSARDFFTQVYEESRPEKASRGL